VFTGSGLSAGRSETAGRPDHQARKSRREVSRPHHSGHEGCQRDRRASLIRLCKEGFVPERDAILALTADEEKGISQNGVKGRQDMSDIEAGTRVEDIKTVLRDPPDPGAFGRLAQDRPCYAMMRTTLRGDDAGGGSCQRRTSNFHRGGRQRQQPDPAGTFTGGIAVRPGTNSCR